MTLIEINNTRSVSNFTLIKQTQDWITHHYPHVGNDYCIVLDPNLEDDFKITPPLESRMPKNDHVHRDLD